VSVCQCVGEAHVCEKVINLMCLSRFNIRDVFPMFYRIFIIGSHIFSASWNGSVFILLIGIFLMKNTK